ncbi:type II toxin-antitoxin system RelE/ParE family toxin [Lactovum odontotermitis]
MSYDVRTTPQSEKDLRDIYEYIAFNLQAPHNAVKQINALEEKILSLSTMPERFRRYLEEPWKSRNLRIMPVGNYLVFYIPVVEYTENESNENGLVTILRVMYGGRDIQKQLSQLSDFPKEK